VSEIARGHGRRLPEWKNSAVDLPWAASRSVVIVMIVMGGVPLSVMQIVDVIAVRHGGHVPTAVAVLVAVVVVDQLTGGHRVLRR
jgi:hypothetical protein